MAAGKKRTDADYQRFINVYEDTEAYPTLNDVADALQLAKRTIREIRLELERRGHEFTRDSSPFLSSNPKVSARKRIEEFYTRRIESILALDRPNTLAPPWGPYEPMVLLGDVHSPFVCHHALEMAYKHIADMYKRFGERLIIVQMGDLFDLYSFSKYPRSQILFTPDAEVTMAREIAVEMFADIRKIAPKARIVLIRGNHDIRPHRKLISCSPEHEAVVNFDGLWQFEGVETHLDVRKPVEISGIVLHHGNKTRTHWNQFSGRPNAHGHTHNGGLSMKKVDGKWTWELDVGYLGDVEAKCFTFTASKPENWTRGIGIVMPGSPIWVPFE